MSRVVRGILVAVVVLAAAPSVASADLVITGKRISDVTVEFTVARGENFGHVDFAISGPYQAANPASDTSGANCAMTTAQVGNCSLYPEGHFIRIFLDVGPTRYCDRVTTFTVGPLFEDQGGTTESGTTTLPSCSGGQPPPKKLDGPSKESVADDLTDALVRMVTVCSAGKFVDFARGGVLDQAASKQLLDALDTRFDQACQDAARRAEAAFEALKDPPARAYKRVALPALPRHRRNRACARIRSKRARRLCRQTDRALTAWLDAGRLAVAAERTLRTTYDRIGGATRAGDNAAAALQGSALRADAALLAEALTKERRAGRRLLRLLERDSLALRMGYQAFDRRRRAYAEGHFPALVRRAVGRRARAHISDRILHLPPQPSSFSAMVKQTSSARALRDFGAEINPAGLRKLFNAIRSKTGRRAAALNTRLKAYEKARGTSARKAALRRFAKLARRVHNGAGALLAAVAGAAAR